MSTAIQLLRILAGTSAKVRTNAFYLGSSLIFVKTCHGRGCQVMCSCVCTKYSYPMSGIYIFPLASCIKVWEMKERHENVLVLLCSLWTIAL